MEVFLRFLAAHRLRALHRLDVRFEMRSRAALWRQMLRGAVHDRRLVLRRDPRDDLQQWPPFGTGVRAKGNHLLGRGVPSPAGYLSV